ncbi:hypothetical protein BJ165DRAFT_1411078 [Panaeolus papilionaceus]|nr:hypothetical protein BJ165DRAFT_1411078 [Panaeolus papilionaceus]
MSRKEGFALKPMREGEETIWTLLRSRRYARPSPPIPAPQHRHHLVTYFLTVTVCSGLKTSLDVLYQGPTPYFNDSDSTVMEGIPVAAPHLNHAVILASGSVQIMMVALTASLTAALERWLEVVVGGCARVGSGSGEEECVTTILVKFSAQKQGRHLNVVILGFHPLQVFLFAPKWLLLARGRWVVGHVFGLGRWMRWRLMGGEDETRNERRDEGKG